MSTFYLEFHKGSVKEIDTNALVPNVVLTAQKEGGVEENISVDVHGEFGEQLSEGRYTVRCGAIGYVEQVFELDLKLTGLKTLNVELVKVV